VRLGRVLLALNDAIELFSKLVFSPISSNKELCFLDHFMDCTELEPKDSVLFLLPLKNFML
jgi:hypothetical protein